MIYLLDTNIFREMLEHFPKRGKTFEEIWERFEKGIKDGVIATMTRKMSIISGYMTGGKYS